MRVHFKPARAFDIPFLNEQKTLYVTDFRSLSEDPTYEIFDMYKYENLSPWLVENRSANDKFVAVNEHSKDIPYIDKLDSNVVIAKTLDKTSLKSVFARLSTIPEQINKLWVGVPHPDADDFAAQNGLELNYTFSDFLGRNNKIRQKQLLGNLTPEWREITTKNEIKKVISAGKGYLKRSIGSGGYAVTDLEHNELEVADVTVDKNHQWYWEKKVSGTPRSLQAFVTNGEVTIFGTGTQLVKDDQYYYGSVIESRSISYKTQFVEAINRLEDALADYEGFIGLDYIEMDGSITVLEANIRMTSATIPTLLYNLMGADLNDLQRRPATGMRI